MIPVAVLIGLWIFVPSDHLNDTVGYIQLPHPDYVTHIPVSLLLIFLAVPLLYSAINSMTVPALESLDTIQDKYTRRPTTKLTSTTQPQWGRPSQ
jgi:PIG-P